MSGPTVAIVGAGGFVFPLALIRDMLCFEAVRAGSIRLFDIDRDRAAGTERLASALMERHGVAAELTVCADRGDALQGAEVVICTLQVGGLEAYGLDVETPREYGIDQPVGDTLGPGGILRGLRTIPVLAELAADMRRCCPRALLIQYANPMAINCWATDQLGVRTVGLCHSVQHTSRMLADELDVPYDEVSFDSAGINHTAWFTRFSHRGRDLLPAIRDTMTRRHLTGQDAGRGAHADVYQGGQERVRSELMALTGFFHTESSHHASEYWPWFRPTPERAADYIHERWDYFESCRRHHLPAAAQELVAAPLVPGEEYAAPLIDSLVTGRPRVIYGNVRNRGVISNLPWDACVEVACCVDANGIRPVRYGELPPACAALNAAHINVQRLVVQAALTGDAGLVRAAMALDPLTGAVLGLPAIRELTDRMLAEQAAWLPQFAGTLSASRQG